MKRVAAAVAATAAPRAKRARKVPPPPPLTDDEVLALQRRLTIDCNTRNASAASARLRLDTDFVNGVNGERKHDYYLDDALLDRSFWTSGSNSDKPFFAPFDRDAVANKVGGRMVGGVEKRGDARDAAVQIALAAQTATDAHRRAAQAFMRLAVVARAYAQPESHAVVAWRNMARVTDEKTTPGADAMRAALDDVRDGTSAAAAAGVAHAAAATQYDAVVEAHAKAMKAAATFLKATWEKSAPFGTHIHAVIETFLSRGTPWRPGVDERPPEGLLRFLVDHPTLDIYRSEMLVFNARHRIMGSIDAIFRCRVTGAFYLCDFKVTKGDMLRVYDGECGTHALSLHMGACKANKYAFQANVYCYMFEEQEGERIEEMFLLQFEPPSCDTYRKYPIARMTNMEEVLAVITAHAQQQRHAEDLEEATPAAHAPA